MWPPSRARKSLSAWRMEARPTIVPSTSATRYVAGTHSGGDVEAPPVPVVGLDVRRPDRRVVEVEPEGELLGGHRLLPRR